MFLCFFNSFSAKEGRADCSRVVTYIWKLLAVQLVGVCIVSDICLAFSHFKELVCILLQNLEGVFF